MKTFSDFVNQASRVEPVKPMLMTPKAQDQQANIRPLTYAEFVQRWIDRD